MPNGDNLEEKLELDEDMIQGAKTFFDIILAKHKEIDAYLNYMNTNEYADGVYSRLETISKETVGKKGRYWGHRQIVKGLATEGSTAQEILGSIDVEDQKAEAVSYLIKRQAADAIDVYSIILAHKRNLKILENLKRFYTDGIMFILSKSTDPKYADKIKKFDKVMGKLGQTYGSTAINSVIISEQKLIANCEEKLEEMCKLCSEDKVSNGPYVTEIERCALLAGYENKVSKVDREEIEMDLNDLMLRELEACKTPQVLYDAVSNNDEWTRMA
jgi:hypothetical protein